jgi:GNAT superfamily N-acetyltransferase
VIRRLNPDDAEAWAALRWEALEKSPLSFGSSHPASVSLLAESVRSRLLTTESAIFGAFHGETLVGIVGVIRESIEKEQHKARIWGMYVTDRSRRGGVGELLLRSAIEQARAWHGVQQVHLSVTDASSDARKLYERIGFKVWGNEPRAIHWQGIYVDEFHMVLML